ncbi:O-antigen translocase [Scleromatobacter humisilvae]|uniref:O-antigen translocase n=1 Tax=Scleromatobacter humisilvae TaxID=2897159 RepID=A0A9X2C264_9BURK|nr:O-antigen translocase [Scleromatobacter humisilvae]MCK9688351.1 O-antigen translocase [Scleromatobacter humisilvae]
MTLVGTTLLNGIAVLARLFTGLALNKVLAVMVGPTGYGVIGQFQSFAGMIVALASAPVTNGVVKYTAEFGGQPERRAAVWRTAATLGLMLSLGLAVLMVCFQRPLAAWSIADADRSYLVVILACALAFMVLNALLLAILNGLKQVRALVVANIAGSVISALTAIGLVTWQGLNGALAALAVSQSVAFVVTLFIFRRQVGASLRSMVGRLDPQLARGLGRFAIMGLTSAIVVPIAQMVMRDHLARTLGWSTAGLWQALWKISETHLLLLTSTLSVYFLPRFAEIQDAGELRRELKRGLAFVIPLVLCTSGLLFFGRNQIVRLMLSDRFLPMLDAFGPQLLGDILKVVSLVPAYTMLSHGQTRVYVVTEILFSAVLAGLTVWFSQTMGLRGAALGYAATYALYGITMWFVLRRLLARLGSKPAPDLAIAAEAAPS